jgi:signal peptidase I
MNAERSVIEKRSPSWLRFIFGRNPSVTLLRIVVLTAVSLLVFRFVLLPIRVTGESMFPNYKDGQIRFVNRLAYLKGSPQRGDVVALEFRGKQVLLLKRIIGLPGEKFHVFNGEVYINGEKLAEPYARGKILSPSGKGYGSTREPIALGPTEYMVIGDNRTKSEGFIKDTKQIVGKVL